MEKLKKHIKVTVAQIGNTQPVEERFDTDNGFSYKNPELMYNKVLKAVEVAKQDDADFLVFPEISVPKSFVASHIPILSNENNIIIIGGVEFYHKYNYADKRYVQNEAFISIPGSKNDLGLREHATVWRIPKLYPATNEENMIRDEGYHFVSGNKLYVFNSQKYGSWAVLICVDYLNLPLQKLLQKKIQTLFIVASNRDLNYYEAMTESLHRLLYCNVIVCNNANYGGSHIYTPYRESYKREALKLLGNNVDTSVTVELPLKIIQEIQHSHRLKRFDGFAQKPPDYADGH